MSEFEIVRRLQAYHKGHPLPAGEKLRVPVPGTKDILVLAFVRMGGESAPWGIAYGRPDRAPKLLSVPEPRDRTAVGDMCAEFSEALLEHFLHPEYREEPPDLEAPPRQVWLPNSGHVEMLHHLAYAYCFTRTGSEKRVKALQGLGRVAGWLFRESRRPGQVFVISAADALKEAHTFPSQQVRQSHLGFLLAWLQTPGGRKAKEIAAAEAEQEAVSMSIDPAIERSLLAPLVKKYDEEGKPPKLAPKICQIIEAELLRRFKLTCDALTVFKTDNRPPNPGLQKLITYGWKEHFYQYWRIEERLNDPDDGPAFVPSPETDRFPAAAASRYYAYQMADSIHSGELAHHDPDLQREFVASGEALAGQVTAVHEIRTERGSQTRWQLVLPPGSLVKAREGSDFCFAGLPGRQFDVLSMGRDDKGAPVVTVAVKDPRSLPERMHPASERWWVGKEVVLLPRDFSGFNARKGQKVWKKDHPGSWLTHGKPTSPRSKLPEEVGEDMDDIIRGIKEGA